MSKRTKIILIVLALAAAAYLVYRWYENNQANSTTGNTGLSSGTSGDSLGSNLNSVAPELAAGSSGPDSGLNYYAGNTTVNLPTLPNGESATSTTTTSGTPVTSTPTATEVVVPNVVNQSLVTAQQNMTKAGLTSTASGPKTTKKGQTRVVTKENPGAGAKVTKGSSVTLTYKVAAL